MMLLDGVLLEALFEGVKGLLLLIFLGVTGGELVGGALADADDDGKA